MPLGAATSNYNVTNRKTNIKTQNGYFDTFKDGYSLKDNTTRAFRKLSENGRGSHVILELGMVFYSAALFYRSPIGC